MTAPDPNTTHWRKSSHSSDKANCVEVAFLDGTVAIRDSKHPTDTALTVTPRPGPPSPPPSATASSTASYGTVVGADHAAPLTGVPPTSHPTPGWSFLRQSDLRTHGFW